METQQFNTNDILAYLCILVPKDWVHNINSINTLWTDELAGAGGWTGTDTPGDTQIA